MATPTNAAQCGGGPAQLDSSQATNIYMMTPKELKNYFLQVAADDWKAKLDDVDIRKPRYATFRWSNQGRVVYHVKHDAEDVPKAVVVELRALRESAASRFEDMMALLREDICEIVFEDDDLCRGSVKMEGVAGATAMLAELAPIHAQMAIDSSATALYPSLAAVKFKLIIIDAIGLSRACHYTLAPIATLHQFLQDLAQRFPSLCRQHDAEASETWRKQILALKSGSDQRTVCKIEELVRTHEAADYEVLGEWLYMKDGEYKTGYYLKTEEQFKEMVAWARKRPPLSCCLMRSVESKILEINRTIRLAEEAQLQCTHKDNVVVAQAQAQLVHAQVETAPLRGLRVNKADAVKGSDHTYGGKGHKLHGQHDKESPRVGVDGRVAEKKGKGDNSMDNDRATMMADTFWEEATLGDDGAFWEDETLFTKEQSRALDNFSEGL